MNGNLNLLVPGDDDFSKVYIHNRTSIMRKYNLNGWTEFKKVRKLLNECPELNDLVIETLEVNGESKFSIHPIVQFSQPYQWSMAQYLDALRTHFYLLELLERRGFTLKDALPNNYSFFRGKCLLVDLSSIIELETLPNLSWINQRNQKKALKFIRKQMLFPFFIYPFLIGLFANESVMRKVLRERYCNSGVKPINFKELLVTIYRNSRKFFPLAIVYLVFYNMLINISFQRYFTKINLYFISILERMNQQSNYTQYYDEKDENHAVEETERFNEKQQAIFNVLRQSKYMSLLDFGCNTGWYSKLASSLGIKVNAIDIDSACISNLFKETRRNYLDINCFVVNFEEFEIFGKSNLDLRQKEYFEFFEEFIVSDIVLALGLVHHLVLGMNKSITSIFEILNKFTNRILILEFVSLNDEKICDHKDFFPFYDQNFRDYSRENFLKIGKLFYTNVTILESYPHSRSLLIFER